MTNNNRSNKILQVPYCYLCKNEDSNLHNLFIHIPTENDKGVLFHKPKQEGCITVIECEIVDNKKDTSFLYTIDLDKQKQLIKADEHCVTDRDTEEDLSIEIRVGWNNEYYVFNQSILFYKNCDIANTQVKNNQAINCPYMYSNRAKNKALLAHLMLTKNGQDHQFGSYEVGEKTLNPIPPVMEITAAMNSSIVGKGIAIEVGVDSVKKTGIVQSTDSDSQPGRFLRRNSKVDEKFKIV